MLKMFVFFIFFSLVAAERTNGLITYGQLREIKYKLESFYDKYNRFPTEQEGLEILVKEKMISEEELMDLWKRPIVYLNPAKYSKKKYDLYSYGSNCENDKGKKDDITVWEKGYDRTYYPTMLRYSGTSWEIIILPISFFLLLYLGNKYLEFKLNELRRDAVENAKRGIPKKLDPDILQKIYKQR